MPELPEVETTLRAIEPFILNQRVTQTLVRHTKLRWPIPKNLAALLQDQTIARIYRRNKYITFTIAQGELILHLGMSGRLAILKTPQPPRKHDHVDILFANGICLRFTDPRRFGALLWSEKASDHALLCELGPEPLEKTFSSAYLFEKTRNKKVSIKVFIMNGKNVTGVGNIYAAEALFMAGIHPEKIAGQITASEASVLVKAIKVVLKKAIAKGGTTLKDFSSPNGSPGYFSQKLKVYGRADQPCYVCHTTLQLIRLGQRSTVFCPKCQKK